MNYMWGSLPLLVVDPVRQAKFMADAAVEKITCWAWANAMVGEIISRCRSEQAAANAVRVMSDVLYRSHPRAAGAMGLFGSMFWFPQVRGELDLMVKVRDLDDTGRIRIDEA